LSAISKENTYASPDSEISSVHNPTWFRYNKKSYQKNENPKKAKTKNKPEGGGRKERLTSNIDIALRKNVPSVSPALVNASTHHNVHKQNVPSSPPTPSSAFRVS